MEQLVSGEKCTLRPPELKRIGLSFFWEMKPEITKNPVNLDFGIMALGEDTKFDFLVNYYKPSFGAVQHFCDCEDDSDEKFIIDLEHLNPKVSKLMVIMVVSFAENRNHSLDMINKLEVKLTDMESNTDLVTWQKENFKNMNDATGMYVCEVYLYKGQWKFHVIDKATTSKSFGQLTKNFH